MIERVGDGQLYRIASEGVGYVLGISHGLPLHYWWGEDFAPSAETVLSPPSSPPPYSVVEDPADPHWSAARAALEYPGLLAGDPRGSALIGTSSAGPIFCPRFIQARVYAGRPGLEGLPHARASEADSSTLELCLRDLPSNLLLMLSYTSFDGSPVIARNVRVVNEGDSPLVLSRIATSSVDLPRGTAMDFISLGGAWARERGLDRRRIGPGTTALGSKIGISSHRFSPAAVLLTPETCEDWGPAWGATLVYSGNWTMSVERDDTDGLRWMMGVGAESFSWHLEPGESFCCPEALLAFSTEGLNGLSRRWHDFVHDRILPPAWRRRPRPVLLNSWEAAYFDVDETRILSIAEGAADLGAELFVLDDGWFAGRQDDSSSLGDWVADPGKLPGGLERLSAALRERGLAFGIWLEPEAVSPDSDLYRSHPDWCLHLPGRPRAEGRNQLVLDLGREEVREELAGRVIEAVQRSGAQYVKWDMNRHLGIALSATSSVERQGEVAHRFMLGAYDLMARVTGALPDVLFEGCAGGGGRMDFGLLYFMPQYWASDDTDPVARAAIQLGTSLFFPPFVTGAHVSASPNHQTGRSSPLSMRLAVAMGGVLGVELDPARLSAEETRELREGIAFYKSRRELLQFGTFYRLQSLPAAGPWSPLAPADVAWMSVGPDRRRAVVTWLRLLPVANPGPVRLRLAGLLPELRYELRRAGTRVSEASGRELCTRGLEFQPTAGEGCSLITELAAVEREGD